MKKYLVAAAFVLFAAPVFAADKPVKKLIYTKAPPAPVYLWTGFYVGGNVGYSWGHARTDLNGAGSVASSNLISGLFPFPIQFAGGSDTVRLKGAIGGAQFGYNYQVNSLWVFGLESDLQISGERIISWMSGAAPPIRNSPNVGSDRKSIA
jgi:outer membrane immunogenic protein